MFGLTPLGTFHTAISLIAVAAGLIAFGRAKQISPINRASPEPAPAGVNSGKT